MMLARADCAGSTGTIMNPGREYDTYTMDDRRIAFRGDGIELFRPANDRRTQTDTCGGPLLE